MTTANRLRPAWAALIAAVLSTTAIASDPEPRGAPSLRAAAPTAVAPATRPANGFASPSDKRDTTVGTAGSGGGGEDLWNDLQAGNRRFVAGRARERELIRTREELSTGQKPKVIVLTCADSRVAPELVFDRNLGEVFTVRVAGNVAEPSAVGSIEYAVEHLGSRLIVIMGHEGCGAVQAAASGEWVPSPNLHEIVKRIGPAIAKVRDEPGAARASAAELLPRQVRANVTTVADDMLRISPILKSAADQGEVTIVRAVYNLKTGEVERLGVPAAATAAADADPEEKPKGH